MERSYGVRKAEQPRKGVAVDLLAHSPYVSAMSEFVALVELGSNAVRCLLASVDPRIGF